MKVSPTQSRQIESRQALFGAGSDALSCPGQYDDMNEGPPLEVIIYIKLSKVPMEELRAHVHDVKFKEQIISRRESKRQHQ
jgi:hypothetical protein